MIWGALGSLLLAAALGVGDAAPAALEVVTPEGRRTTLGRAPMRTMQTRRDFVAVASAAGAASLLGPGPAAAEEGPP